MQTLTVLHAVGHRRIGERPAAGGCEAWRGWAVAGGKRRVIEVGTHDIGLAGWHFDMPASLFGTMNLARRFLLPLAVRCHRRVVKNATGLSRCSFRASFEAEFIEIVF
jgi:hypothetical protein